MDEVYASLLNIFSQEVVPYFYVFGSGVKHGVFGKTNCGPGASQWSMDDRSLVMSD
jgi:hypothetical protein